jgi:hypothetical protein
MDQQKNVCGVGEATLNFDQEDPELARTLISPDKTVLGG